VEKRKGVFLERKNFQLNRTSGRVELHTKDYPDFVEESFRLDLFLRGFAWFVDYEQWIARRMPDGYRELCLATFPRKAFPGTELAQRWRDMIRRTENDQHIDPAISNETGLPVLRAIL
jgi:hypothetical protein